MKNRFKIVLSLVFIIIVCLIIVFILYNINNNKNEDKLDETGPIINELKLNIDVNSNLSITIYKDYAVDYETGIKKISVAIYDKEDNFISEKVYNYQENIDEYIYNFNCDILPEECYIVIEVHNGDDIVSKKTFFRKMGYPATPVCEVYDNYVKCDKSLTYNLEYSTDFGKSWNNYENEMLLDFDTLIIRTSMYYNNEKTILKTVTYNFVNK